MLDRFTTAVNVRAPVPGPAFNGIAALLMTIVYRHLLMNSSDWCYVMTNFYSFFVAPDRGALVSIHMAVES